MAPRFLIAALFAVAASAQTSDRTFYTPHVQSPADLTSIVNAVRSVGDIQQVTGHFSKKAINVTGNTAQLSFADWATHELDNPTRSPSPREYRIAPDPSIVRIYYLTYIKTPQEIQEVCNAVRSSADIQRFFPYNTAAAIIARGSADQMAAVDWALHELDQPAPAKTSPDFPPPGLPGRVLKVFAVKNGSPQQLQELVNVTRSIADIQRLFPLNFQHAIIAQGTTEEIAVAGWTIQQLDSAAPTPPLEYRTTDKFNPVVRIAFLGDTVTPQARMETAVAVRTATRMQRVFANNLHNAIAMRGTADQISRADLVLKERAALQ
jgi:hypothetical protein